MPLPTVPQVFADPEFHQLPVGEQQKVIARIDSDFAGLPGAEQSKALIMLHARFSRPAVSESERIARINALPDVTPQGRAAMINSGAVPPAPLQQEQSKLPDYYGFGAGNLVNNVVRGLKELGQGAVQMTSDIGGLVLPHALGGDPWGQSKLQEHIVQPMQAEAAKARQEQAQGKGSWVGHAIASGVPVVGPWAANLGEQAGTGDIGGAAARGGTQVVAAEAIPRVVGKVANAVGKKYSVADMTSTTPERIADLQAFPARIENVRQTIVNAEQQAHANASAAFPKFDKPIETGRMVEKPAQGPTMIDEWGEVNPTAQVPETTTFKALQEQRSNLLKNIANETRAVNRGATPRFDLADMYGELRQLDNTMDRAALEQGGQAGLDQLHAARQQYGTYMNDFHAPGSPLRAFLEAKPGQTQAVVNKLLAPDGARALETLRSYGVDTSPIQNMLAQGDRPLRVIANESAKLRKAGSPDAYTVQRLNESISQATTNEMPSSAQARLPASVMRSKWPSVAGEIPGANVVTPRDILAWRLKRALKQRTGKQ